MLYHVLLLFLCYVLPDESPAAILVSKLLVNYIHLKGNLIILDYFPTAGPWHIHRSCGRWYSNEGSSIPHALLTR